MKSRIKIVVLLIAIMMVMAVLPLQEVHAQKKDGWTWTVVHSNYFGWRYYYQGDYIRGIRYLRDELPDGTAKASAFYFEENYGLLQEGLQEYEGATYYFAPVKNYNLAPELIHTRGGERQEGWVRFDDHLRYFKDDNLISSDNNFGRAQMVKGHARIKLKDGGPTTFLFDDETGLNYKGWKYYEDKDNFRYFNKDNDGIMLENTSREIGGERYCFDNDGFMRLGWYNYGNQGLRYFLDKQNGATNNTLGIAVKGVKYLQTDIGAGTFYFDEETGLQKYGWKMIDGHWRFFDSNKHGMMLQNEFYEYYPNEYYYFGANGDMAEGWTVIKGKTYYFDPDSNSAYHGLMAQDEFLTIDGNTYYFGEDGARLSGWQQINGKQYYFDPQNNDVMVTGKRKVGNTVYVFHNDGHKEHGWKRLAGKDYYFDPNYGGGMVTGKRKVGNTVYVFHNDGHKEYGWKRLAGKDYYFDPNYGGGMVTGKRKVGNTTYVFHNNGYKEYGWKVLSGKKYYFDPNYGGGMVTSLRKVGNGRYYFYPQEGKGYAATNTWIKIGNKSYYFNASGLNTKIK